MSSRICEMLSLVSKIKSSRKELPVIKDEDRQDQLAADNLIAQKRAFATKLRTESCLLAYLPC